MNFSFTVPRVRKILHSRERINTRPLLYTPCNQWKKNFAMGSKFSGAVALLKLIFFHIDADCWWLTCASRSKAGSHLVFRCHCDPWVNSPVLMCLCPMADVYFGEPLTVRSKLPGQTSATVKDLINHQAIMVRKLCKFKARSGTTALVPSYWTSVKLRYSKYRTVATQEKDHAFLN